MSRPTSTSEKVYALIMVAMIFGLAAFSSCDEADASVKREPPCCGVRNPTLAYPDSLGNAVIVGQVGHTLAYVPGAVLGDEAELAAEIGSRCMETVKRTLKRHPDVMWLVACIENDVPIGTKVSPEPAPSPEE